MGGAELDGRLEVRTHAHGQEPKAKIARLLTQKREVRSGIIRFWRNTHEPSDWQIKSFTAKSHELGELAWHDPALLLFFAGVNLHQKHWRFRRLANGSCKRLGKARPVDTVNDIEQGNSVRGLVALQLPDQMQTNIRVLSTQRGPFGLRLLDAIFPKVPLPALQCWQYSLRTVGFADRNQCNVIRRAAREPRCGANALLHCLQRLTK